MHKLDKNDLKYFSKKRLSHTDIRTMALMIESGYQFPLKILWKQKFRLGINLIVHKQKIPYEFFLCLVGAYKESRYGVMRTFEMMYYSYAKNKYISLKEWKSIEYDLLRSMLLDV